MGHTVSVQIRFTDPMISHYLAVIFKKGLHKLLTWKDNGLLLDVYTDNAYPSNSWVLKVFLFGCFGFCMIALEGT